MKRCPQCGRDYNDPTLSFCLDDGTGLLDGPSSIDEPLTAILPEDVGTSESPNRTFDPEETENTRLYSDHSGEAAPPAASRKTKLVAGLVGILLVAALGIGWYWFYGRESSKQIDSVAVMPFVNESGDEEVEYLSDGMTETLINNLSQVPGLKVKARTLVFRFKGKESDPKTVAEQLGVQAILYGRILQRGERLTLSLELINAATGNVLWGNKYERSASELAALQTDVANDVSGKLRARDTDDSTRLSRRNTQNSEAYQAYLKGRFAWNRRDPEGFQKATRFFEEAIALDPNFALAWSGLADTNLLMPEYGDYSSKEYMPKARKAAEKALELDPTLAEALTSLAYVEHSFDWNFTSAETKYKKAIELDPEYATAYQWYSEMLGQERRFEEAIIYAEKALDLDPLAPIKGYVLANIQFFAGDEKASEKQLRKTLEVSPDFVPASASLSRRLAAQGKVDEAIAVCDDIIRAGDSRYASCKGLAYAYAGDKANTRKFLSGFRYSELREAYKVATIYALIGDHDKALELLGTLFDDRFANLLQANAEPGFDGMRKDPRFIDLMRRVGLPTE